MLAATFLSRLPLPAVPLPGTLAEAGWAFPLVGAGIGGVGGIAFGLATVLGLPVSAAALMAIFATVLFTGALHEDGLADTADGLGGGRTLEQRLAIMRDSRSGAFGVLALIFSVGLRASALFAIGRPGLVLAALVAAHAVARGALPLVMSSVPTARPEGLGATAGRPDPATARWALALAAAIAVAALGVRPAIVGFLCSGAVMAGLAGMARRLLGGYTGDILGAIEQGGEIVMLLAAVAWIK